MSLNNFNSNCFYKTEMFFQHIIEVNQWTNSYHDRTCTDFTKLHLKFVFLIQSMSYHVNNRRHKIHCACFFLKNHIRGIESSSDLFYRSLKSLYALGSVPLAWVWLFFLKILRKNYIQTDTAIIFNITIIIINFN